MLALLQKLLFLIFVQQNVKKLSKGNAVNMKNNVKLLLLTSLVSMIFVFSSCGKKEEQNLSVTNPYLADWPSDVPIPPAAQFTGITQLEGNNNYNFQVVGKPRNVYDTYKSLIEKNGFTESLKQMNEEGGKVVWVKGSGRRVIFSIYLDKQICVITIARN
jgi:hypothetical protein